MWSLTVFARLDTPTSPAAQHVVHQMQSFQSKRLDDVRLGRGRVKCNSGPGSRNPEGGYPCVRTEMTVSIFAKGKRGRINDKKDCAWKSVFFYRGNPNKESVLRPCSRAVHTTRVADPVWYWPDPDPGKITGSDRTTHEDKVTLSALPKPQGGQTSLIMKWYL